jgi:YD repeat-containing protein
MSHWADRWSKSAFGIAAMLPAIFYTPERAVGGPCTGCTEAASWDMARRGAPVVAALAPVVRSFFARVARLNGFLRQDAMALAGTTAMTSGSDNIGEPTPPWGDDPFVQPPAPPSVEVEDWSVLGVPPPWGAGLAISPFSLVNLKSGNVLTAITLTGWDPVGPPVSFSLYHNSLTAATGPDPNAWGFDLGGGWSVSYGAHLENADPNDPNHPPIVLVGDDGSRTLFCWDPNGGVWRGPPGTYYELKWNGPTFGEWVLTKPDLTTLVFNSRGYLSAVRDPFSAYNAASVQVWREGSHGGRISQISNHGVLNLAFYDDGPWEGRLRQINDPGGRRWGFTYDDAGRLHRILYCNLLPDNDLTYPLDPNNPESYVEFTYDPASRLASVRSRDGLIWTYEYDDDGRLLAVFDPEDPNTPRRPTCNTSPTTCRRPAGSGRQRGPTGADTRGSSGSTGWEICVRPRIRWAIRTGGPMIANTTYGRLQIRWDTPGDIHTVRSETC